jgi:hypothetical protein
MPHYMSNDVAVQFGFRRRGEVFKTIRNRCPATTIIHCVIGIKFEPRFVWSGGSFSGNHSSTLSLFGLSG